MTTPQIFDRTLVRTRRERAAADFAAFDFLYAEVCARLTERLELMQRSFTRSLILGSRTGRFATELSGRFGIKMLVQSELASQMAGQAQGARVVADEEWLPFAEAAFDLVVSPVSLHSTNDLPGALTQIRRVLKPDGLFLGALFGVGTLAPMRQAFLTAETSLGVGSSPHVAPFTEVRDAGALLQRAGFALPVADAEPITVTYRNPMRLLADLRGMGESNVLVNRTRRPLRRDVLVHAMERLVGVTIPFEIVFVAGWAPSESQQQPLPRGSGQVSLATVLGKDKT